jgi:predicted DNA-binding transcriptional regulator YafY
MKGLLKRAMDEKLPLEMIYISSKNQITKRIILVKEIKGTTIRAYCFLRKQTRLFKVDQILSILPAKGSRSKIIG